MEEEKSRAEKAEKAEEEARLKPVSEVKTERLNSSASGHNNSVEMDDLFDKIRASDMSKPIEVGAGGCASGGSSDDEIPLNRLKDRAVEQESGIEWKPVVGGGEKGAAGVASGGCPVSDGSHFFCLYWDSSIGKRVWIKQTN